MDIKYKIKLIEALHLRPADLDYIDSVVFSTKCLDTLMENNTDLLDKELGEIAGNENVDEKTRLVAASLKNQLLWISASDALDKACETFVDGDDDSFDDFDDFRVEDTWENKLYKEKQGDPKEREKAFKEGKKLLENLSVEELTMKYCEFILQKYPQLKDGFDNGLCRMGMTDYQAFIGINGKEYLLTTELSHRVYFARRGVADGLNKMIDSIYLTKLEYWKTEYKSWLEGRHETRISKKSLKQFFEEQGKKPSDKVLDKMKMEL